MIDPAVKHYEGSCHCGKVTFQALANFQHIYECNCSFCEKIGALWSGVARNNFSLTCGADNLTTYYFTPRRLYNQYFCKTCGVLVYGDNNRTKSADIDNVDINMRCLKNFDITKQSIEKFDGRSL
ncbi:MAG: GFA family protein [Alphaproteobacteria bacterium]